MEYERIPRRLKKHFRNVNYDCYTPYTLRICYGDTQRLLFGTGLTFREEMRKQGASGELYYNLRKSSRRYNRNKRIRSWYSADLLKTYGHPRR